MNNAGWYSELKISKSIKRIGLQLYPLEYLLELNPLERLWSSLKDNTLKHMIRWTNLNCLYHRVLPLFLSMVWSGDVGSMISEYNWQLV